jgi:hypothetical protein
LGYLVTNTPITFEILLATMISKTNMILFFIFFKINHILFNIFSNFISQSPTLKFAHQIRIEF